MTSVVRKPEQRQSNPSTQADLIPVSPIRDIFSDQSSHVSAGELQTFYGERPDMLPARRRGIKPRGAGSGIPGQAMAAAMAARYLNVKKLMWRIVHIFV